MSLYGYINQIPYVGGTVGTIVSTGQGIFTSVGNSGIAFLENVASASAAIPQDIALMEQGAANWLNSPSSYTMIMIVVALGALSYLDR